MSDITPEFHGLLKERGTLPTRGRFEIEQLNEFLQEAYRISSGISQLHHQLRQFRQAYLSTAAPRKIHLRGAKTSSAAAASSRPTSLTDREREEIDANAKKNLRDLNALIRSLSDAEEVRRRTEDAVLTKKHGRGLGALGRWAAGSGGGLGKTAEHVAAEEAARQRGLHRENVLWFLKQRLQEVGALQQQMMQTRLTREMEKNRSVLAKARGSGAPLSFGYTESRSAVGLPGPSQSLAADEREGTKPAPEEQFTQEEIQMFEKDNKDMLKYYQGTLDKVRTAEQSLIEIAELQTLLVNNLTTQSEHIEQLVVDSQTAAENVGGGNKQLKKATQRASPARYTFFAATGLCVFLIGWDFFI